MANQRLRIGIDVDYTLFSCDSWLYKILARLKFSSRNKKLKYCEVSQTEVANVGSFCSLIKAFNPKFYKEYSNASKFVNLLKDKGHYIYIITSRPTLAPFVASLQSWLQGNDIKYDKLIMGCSNKSQFAIENSIDIMIDDLEHNCQAMQNSGIKSLLFKGDSINTERASGLEVVNSWASVYAKVQTLVLEKE